MIDWLFIMLLAFAIFLTVFAIEKEGHPFWNLMSITISIVLWFILAVSVMQIEIPYQIFNATSGNIETGYQVFTSPISPYLTYLFSGIAIINMIYLIAMVYDKWISYKP